MWEIQSASQWSRCWRIHLGTHLFSLGTQFPSPLITHIGQGFIGPIWLWKRHMDQLNFLGFQDLNSTFLLVHVLKVGSCLANVHSYGPTLCLEPVLAIGWVLWLKVVIKPEKILLSINLPPTVSYFIISVAQECTHTCKISKRNPEQKEPWHIKIGCLENWRLGMLPITHTYTV